MNIKMIIAITGLVFYAALFVSYFVRRKFVTLNAGDLLLKLPGNVPLKDIVIFIVCLAMIVIVPFRNFAFYLNVVFILVALIAEEMAVRDLMIANNAGVYSKKVLYGTYSIFFEEIELLPTIAYEDDPETTQVDKRWLKIILKNGNQIEFGFETAEERNKVVEVILQQEPRLKP